MCRLCKLLILFGACDRNFRSSAEGRPHHSYSYPPAPHKGVRVLGWCFLKPGGGHRSRSRTSCSVWWVDVRRIILICLWGEERDLTAAFGATEGWSLRGPSARVSTWRTQSFWGTCSKDRSTSRFTYV